jgi:hypothetical protein
MTDTAWLVIENIALLICACLMVYYYSPWFILILCLVNTKFIVTHQKCAYSGDENEKAGAAKSIEK